MRGAIGLSIALFGLLVAVGWRDSAGTIAAGFLLVACVGVCVWAGVQGRITDREVDGAIARMATAREAGDSFDGHRPTGRRPSPVTEDRSQGGQP